MIYTRPGSPWYYAAFYVKAPDGTLVKKALSTKTADKNKALDFERDMKRSVEDLREKRRIESFIIDAVETMSGKTISRPGMPLSVVWGKYASDKSQSKRTPRTQNAKRIVWERFCKWVKLEYAQVETLNDVSREIADAYLKTLSGKRAATYNNEKNSLSSIWHILTVEAGLKENIWSLFSGAEGDSVRYRDFSIEEVRNILAVSSDLWRCLVAVGFHTGLRLKDAAHLRKSQIQGDYIELIPDKTQRIKKKVTIFIHPDLKKILDYQIFALQKNADYLFPEAVEQYGKYAFQMQFGKILELAKVAEDARGIVGFHSLRHTFVTMAETAGISRQTIQGIVGHGSPLMTEHYSHDTKASHVIALMPSLLLTDGEEAG